MNEYCKTILRDSFKQLRESKSYFELLYQSIFLSGLLQGMESAGAIDYKVHLKLKDIKTKTNAKIMTKIMGKRKSPDMPVSRPQKITQLHSIEGGKKCQI